jgi:hypothetical protein
MGVQFPPYSEIQKLGKLKHIFDTIALEFAEDYSAHFWGKVADRLKNRSIVIFNL